MKTGFWLRNGKGKLAGATVYQQNGQTVMREIVSPANPKTDAQMIQRIIMHTIMQAYSTMRDICDHSFEGVKAGQDTMSLFLKQNIQFCRSKVAQMQEMGLFLDEIFNFVPLGEKYFASNQYQVAMGSLPSVTTALSEDELTLIVAAIGENSYQSVIDSLGLERGDQLTFLLVDQRSTQLGRPRFQFARVILDPTNEDGTPAPLSTPFIAEGAINAPSVRNENTENIVFGHGASGLTFQPTGRYVTIEAGAVIVSRKMGDKWLRSTTYLTYAAEGDSLGSCLEKAKSGTANPIYTANEKYLNNAGTGGVATAAGLTMNRVTVAGNIVTLGTTYNWNAAGATTAAVVINATNTAGYSAKLVKASDGSSVGTAEFVDGVATINAVGLVAGATYKVVLVYQGADQPTGYQFVVAANPAPAGDDDNGD